MKKTFIILALCAGLTMTSCRWIHETFYSVEGCTEWYLDEIYENAIDGDIADAEERYSQMLEWLKGLDSGDAAKAEKAALEWIEKHPFAQQYMDEF